MYNLRCGLTHLKGFIKAHLNPETNWKMRPLFRTLPLLQFEKLGTLVNLPQFRKAISRISPRSQKADAMEKGKMLPEFVARGGFYEKHTLVLKWRPGEQSGSITAISKW